MKGKKTAMPRKTLRGKRQRHMRSLGKNGLKKKKTHQPAHMGCPQNEGQMGKANCPPMVDN
jgi:hypothetical protein